MWENVGGKRNEHKMVMWGHQSDSKKPVALKGSACEEKTQKLTL